MSAVNVIINIRTGYIPVVLLYMVTAVTLLFPSLPALAAEGEENEVMIKVITVITRNEQGERLQYPADIAYDRDRDETYVVVGGKGNIIVYGSNFFPTATLGPGRGADAPRGAYIDNEGMVYVCQGTTLDRKARITIFNPAFFPVDEITFDDIPDAEDFTPTNLIIGQTGNIYVTGQNARGLLVLDKDGNFLHWLKPMDLIFDQEILQETNTEEADTSPVEDAPPETSAEPEETDTPDMRDLLPADLLPTQEKNYIEENAPSTGPVKVTDVTRDKEGHLYVLSAETSKVYVYSLNEELLFSFGQKGGSTGKMSRPKSLAIDEEKKAVYVVDYMRHTILIYDLGGTFMYEFGGMGTGPGWFQFPSSIALNRDGNLIVADLFNQRVQVLDIAFEYKFPLFNASPKKQRTDFLEGSQEISPQPGTAPEEELEQSQKNEVLEPAPLEEDEYE
ncbi:MAG: hypothetical protein GXO58_02275 [Thermodesulfobacteria bacterium]|nr:hypothetical protein [Thermodesulfobacteriota bacterium]